jgi:hypothetical protein
MASRAIVLLLLFWCPADSLLGSGGVATKMSNSSTPSRFINAVQEFGTMTFIQDRFPHIVIGLCIGFAIVFFIRHHLKKVDQRKEIKNLQDLESQLEADYPYITAFLAFLVVAANISIITGLLLSAESVNKVLDHVGDGANVGIVATQEFESDIDYFEIKYYNFTKKISDAVAEIQLASDLAKHGVVEIADAVSKTADAAVKSELYYQAEVLFTDVNSKLDKIDQINLLGTRYLGLMATTAVFETQYGSMAIDVNTLAYIADQAELALEMLDSAASEMDKYCKVGG